MGTEGNCWEYGNRGVTVGNMATERNYREYGNRGELLGLWERCLVRIEAILPTTGELQTDATTAALSFVA